jgi:hypothetical protein
VSPWEGSPTCEACLRGTRVVVLAVGDHHHHTSYVIEEIDARECERERGGVFEYSTVFDLAELMGVCLNLWSLLVCFL